MWITSMGNHGAVGVSQNAGILVVLVDFQQCNFQNSCLVAILDFLVSGLHSWHGFPCITSVCFGISNLNFICVLFVAMDQSLFIFSDVTFKKGQNGSHLEFFSFRFEYQVQSSVAHYLCIWNEACWFSVDVTFKIAAWRPYWIFQFPDSNFSLALNIKSKL